MDKAQCEALCDAIRTEIPQAEFIRPYVSKEQVEMSVELHYSLSYVIIREDSLSG